VSLKQRLRFTRDVFHVNRSRLFDADWYERTYPDSTAAGLQPAVHFLTEGWRAGLDPGPQFSTRWYLEQNPNVWASGINPLLHFLRGGAAEGRLPRPGWTETLVTDEAASVLSVNDLLRDASLLVAAFFTTDLSRASVRGAGVTPAPRFVPGHVRSRPEKRTVLVCAHASGVRLFGAERSLLDVLNALNNLGFNVFTTLPTPNPDYERSVASLCQGIYVFAYPQWSKDFSEIEEVVQRFERVIDQHNVDIIHVNTIMPREPLTAACRLRKISIVHARELITSDAALAEAIGVPPAEIVSRVLNRADVIVANSAATAECYRDSERVRIVHNCVDVDQLDMPNRVTPSSVSIALIGSNTLEKGIEDFLDLAELLHGRVKNANLLVIGSEPPAVIQHRWDTRAENLSYAGYSQRGEEAIAQANIVVNLSRVPESFGRTVVEAMAARRPVIAYDHGAVTELIEHGESGFLVPVGDVHAVAAQIEMLCSNIGLIGRVGECGRQRAVAEYSPQVAQRQLAAVYESIS
jgi:glycosyltransferase involved in cell wall biosynthesis